MIEEVYRRYNHLINLISGEKKNLPLENRIYNLAAFVSISLLNDIVFHNRITQPDLILNRHRLEVKKSLQQSISRESTKDGMDMSICVIDNESRTLQFAGAFNSIYVCRNNKLVEYKADRMPVGVRSGKASVY